jgi:hypothetical protein
MGTGASRHSDPDETIARLLPTFVPGEPNAKTHYQFKRFLCVENFAQRKAHQQFNVLDVRDFGVGIDRHFLLDVFEPFEAGPWTIKQSLSARPSYMHAPLTLVASRRKGSPLVSLTAVKRLRGPKGDRYHFLVAEDGLVPQLSVAVDQFPVGTLVRFTGFEGKLYNGFKERSVQGALDRVLPRLSFPVPVAYHELGLDVPRTQARLAVGALHRLDRLKERGEVYCSSARCNVGGDPVEIRRYAFYKSALKNTGNDVLRDYCRPREPVLFVCGDQTIASAARPPTLTPPVLMILDCSKLTEAKRQKICADQTWRDELASKALTKLDVDAMPKPSAARSTNLKAELPRRMARQRRKPRESKRAQLSMILTHDQLSMTMTHDQLVETISAVGSASLPVEPVFALPTPAPQARVIAPPKHETTTPIRAIAGLLWGLIGRRTS